MNETMNETSHPLIGYQVVVRAGNAGVHYGVLQHAGEFVHLSDSHRVWSWEGAFTLSELSQIGITGGRIACAVPWLSIPIGDVAEILNLTTRSHESLSNYVE